MQGKSSTAEYLKIDTFVLILHSLRGRRFRNEEREIKDARV